MKQVLRIFLLLSITALVGGCKLAVIVVEGGEVQSTASGTCAAGTGTICVNQVEDTSYSEAFTAIPSPGWKFKKWNSGEGFLCQGSTVPTCVINAQGAKGNEVIEDIIASDSTTYIMPIFVRSPPITDTVTFNGIVWAQADLFGTILANEMNALCPVPERLCSGFLNGYDIDAWKWASVEDVSDLLVSLGGPPLTYPPSFHDGGTGSDWAPAFFDLGFRISFESAGQTFVALTSTSADDCQDAPPACSVDVGIADRANNTFTDFVELRGSGRSSGVLLYKPKSSRP